MTERKVGADWVDKGKIWINRTFAAMGGVGLGTSISSLIDPNLPEVVKVLGLPGVIATVYGLSLRSFDERKLKQEGKI